MRQSVPTLFKGIFMFEKPRVFYCIGLHGEGVQTRYEGQWFKEVNLPFMLPEGTTVWVYAVEFGNCGPYFPVDIVGYEYWMRGDESEKEGYIQVLLEFTDDNLERFGGANAIARVLQFEGWEQNEPKL